VAEVVHADQVEKSETTAAEVASTISAQTSCTRKGEREYEGVTSA